MAHTSSVRIPRMTTSYVATPSHKEGRGVYTWLQFRGHVPRKKGRADHGGRTVTRVYEMRNSCSNSEVVNLHLMC